MVLDLASWTLIVAGALTCIVAGIGLNRLPDFYCRLHAAGMADSLGAPLILLGLSLQAGLSLVTIKLLTIWVFLYITAPTATQAIAKAAFATGVRVGGIDGSQDDGRGG